MKKNLRRALGAIVAIVMLLSFAAIPTMAVEIVIPTEDWDADENGVFHVTSASDFVAFLVNAEPNTWYTGKTVSIDADIDLTGVEIPQAVSFRGQLLGNGHTIYNPTITSAGMFGNIGDGVVIENLAIVGGTVNAVHPAIFARDVIAAGNLTFRNVYVQADITCASGSQYAGAFFGRHAGAGTLTFDNCVSACKISSDVPVAGGIGGYIGQTNAHKFTLKFVNCASYCDLSAALGDRGVGGFVGYMRTNIELSNCFSACKQSGQDKYGAIGSITPSAVMTPAFALKFADCYSAVSGSAKAFAAEANSIHHSVEVKNGESTDLTIAAGTDIATKLADLNGAVKYYTANDALIAALGADKWVATETDVTYGTNSTMKMVLPVGVKDLTLVKPAETPDENPGETPDETPDNKPTETPDDKPTETPNDKPTETPETKAPETKAPETSATADTEPKDEGCGSVIGISAIAIVAAAGVAVTVVRKKED